MPSVAYTVVSGIVVLGLTLNLLNFGGLLPAAIFNVWSDIAGIVGLSILPQVRVRPCPDCPSFGCLDLRSGRRFLARRFWQPSRALTRSMIFL